MSIKTQRLLTKAKKLSKKGELKEAQEIFTSILKSHPTNLEAKNGLSLLKQDEDIKPKKSELEALLHLYNNGQYNKAISETDKLTLKYNKNSFLYNLRGACLSEIGDLDASIQSLEKAISLKPDYAEALFNIGVSYQKIGQSNEAFKAYQKAISSNHAYPSAHHNIGLIFLERNQLNDALKSFEWAIAYNPNYVEAQNSLGIVFKSLSQFENAYNQFKKAIELNGSYSQAFYNLGLVCEILNQNDEAIKAYKNAIAINPENFSAHRLLSQLKKYEQNDPHIKELLSLYSRDNLSDSDKSVLGYAMSEVHKDLGNHKEYFNFLDEANSLRKKVLSYSFKDSKNFHSIIKKVFNSPQPDISKKLISPKKIRPIFIVGMPRSGTTLIEQILSSHRNVHGGGELLALRKIISPILDKQISENNYSFQEENFLSIREEYLNFLMELRSPENIITDKMPMNFRLIGFILKAMPESKIIHIKRDARATCWSNYKHFFGDGNGFSFNHEDLTNFYKLYCKTMDFWHSLFPGQIYDINYEKLTTNQKSETQKLLDYCNLDWDENCLDFHKNKRAIATYSKSQVREKMYQGSSEAWKKYESYIKPIISGLKGY